MIDEEEAAQRRRGELEEIYGAAAMAGVVYGDDAFCYVDGCVGYGTKIEEDGGYDVLHCSRCGAKWATDRPIPHRDRGRSF
jgi:hypothetical protein